jgi:hypothetical protein
MGGARFCAFAVADLLRREPASADAAAPARRGGLRDSGHKLLIRAFGSYQFAIALRTLSLNHKPLKPRRDFASSPGHLVLEC